GPVTAAAVILPATFKNNILTDSKQLTEKVRIHLKSIIEKECVCFSFFNLWPDTIDRINILNASIECMHHSIKSLRQQPEFILVDGNRFKKFGSIPHQTIIKGDSKYLSIAAASIIAKTERDALMTKLHEEYPMYNWKNNKGYPTKEHREAIREYGITKYHRKSFRLLPEQLELSFN
ncbi:MAG: ribonuclease HII, partial [Flavobacteriaceae bacterium]|nr:ribonuclease HII [Flavobacteriaceae bacterium]